MFDFGLYTQVSDSGPWALLFEISEDMVQTLLMLEVLFTQDSKVEDLFLHSTYIYRFFFRLRLVILQGLK